MAYQPSPKKIQQHRDDLIGEHTIGDVGQIVLVCLFAVVWIADTFFFKYSTFLNQFVPLIVRVLSGLILLVFSGYLAKTGLSIVFGEEREKPVIIRKSVFNVIRHPIYLSEILLYLGLLIISISFVSIIVWILTIGFLHYISRYEERLLRAEFGEEYEQYMREVPMWVPRLRKR
ncbi:MAG: methyltransferase [Thermodesulfobacteriota bacterium]|nr:methyltransferase [Thermodesulfobacteriota bacterium]